MKTIIAGLRILISCVGASILAALLVLISSVPVSAQVRLLAGVAGGDSFSNTEFGGSVSIEAPFLKRYELDLKDRFYPVESHVALGTGRANNASLSAIVWLTDKFGVTATGEYSNYDVTKAQKGGVYIYGGPIYRTILWGSPIRLEADYVQQGHNGIDSGVETNHLKGGAFSFDVRLGCTGTFCWRMKEQFAVGQIWNQGNPVCDGTYGPVSPGCARSRGVGGSATASVMIEFPRRRDTEDEAF